MAKVTVTHGTTEAGKCRGCSATAQAVGVTAAAEVGSSGRSDDSGLRWEGECEVKK